MPRGLKRKKAQCCINAFPPRITQRSRESQWLWDVEVRYTTSTSWESHRTWSGTQPASSALSAASTWTRPALVSSGTERLTVREIMQGTTSTILRNFYLFIIVHLLLLFFVVVLFWGFFGGCFFFTFLNLYRPCVGLLKRKWWIWEATEMT